MSVLVMACSAVFFGGGEVGRSGGILSIGVTYILGDRSRAMLANGNQAAASGLNGPILTLWAASEEMMLAV